MADKVGRAALQAALAQLNLAIRQMAQVNRCVALALLATMKDEQEDALKQIEEASTRLNEVNDKLNTMMEISERLGNAGE